MVKKVDGYKINAAKFFKKTGGIERYVAMSQVKGHLGVTVSCRPDNKKRRGGGNPGRSRTRVIAL